MSSRLTRRAWLDRHTELRSRTSLKRYQPLAQVSAKRAAVGGQRGRPKDTGPDRATRELVYERDDWCCFCCGVPLLNQPRSLQHRDDRGMGGTRRPEVNSPANLILLAGSGVTACHGRVERRCPVDNDRGYWLKHGQDPATTPVWHWRHGWVLLDHTGGMALAGGDAA